MTKIALLFLLFCNSVHGVINWENRLQKIHKKFNWMSKNEHIFSYLLLNYVFSDLCKFKQTNSADPKILSTEEKRYLSDSIVAITLLGKRNFNIIGEREPSSFYTAEQVTFFKEKTYTGLTYKKIVETLNLKEKDNAHLQYLFDTFCKMFCASYFYYCDLWLCNLETISSFLKIIIIKIYNFDDFHFDIQNVFEDIFKNLENKVFGKKRYESERLKVMIFSSLQELDDRDGWKVPSEIMPSLAPAIIIRKLDKFLLNEDQCGVMLGMTGLTIGDLCQEVLKNEKEQEIFYNNVKAAAGATTGLVAVGSGVLQLNNARTKKDTSPKKYMMPAGFCLAGLAALGYAAVKVVS